MKVLALQSPKGGVGKTAAAVNLAWLASRHGWRSLLWDLDPQNAAGWYLGVDQPPAFKPGKLARAELPLGRFVQRTAWEGLDVLGGSERLRNIDHVLAKTGDSRKLLRRACEPFTESYSLLVLDCPTGLSRLAENILRLADEVIVPVIPSPLAVRGWQQLIEFAAETKKPPHFRAMFSMVDRRRRMHRDWIAQPPEGLAGRVMRFWLPYASAVERMGVNRAPVAWFERRSPAAHAYAGIWQELATDLIRDA